MSITQQVTPNVLNGMLAAGWNGSEGKPGGDNELIKSIPGNAIMKPTFDFPEAQPPFGEAYNGLRDFGTWWHVGQLYLSDANFSTYTGNNWSANFPAFKDLGGVNLDNQKKVLKMYGAGTNFPDNTGDKANTDNTRGENNSNIPLCAFSETAPAAAFGSSSVWSKHGWCGTVNKPLGTHTITFGVYAKVPADDDFRDKNCGGMYIHQNASAVEQEDQHIDAIVIKKSTDTMNLVTGQQSTGLNSMQQWNGLSAWFAGDTPVGNRKDDVTDIRSITYADSSDFRNFTKIEKTVSNQTTPGNKVGFELFFGENQSNLDESGTPSGAILFYNPYIIFKNSSGEILDARRSGTITISHTGPGTHTATVSTYENSAFTATYSASNPLVIPFDIDNFELFNISVSPETVFSHFSITGVDAESGSIGPGGGSIACYWDGDTDVVARTTST